MNESNRIGILLFLYSRNELSPEEDIELQNWRKLSPDNERLFDEMGDPDFVRNRMADFYKERDEIFTRLKSQFPELGSYSAYDDDYLGSDSVTVSEYEGVRLNFPEKDIADSGLSKAEFWNGLLEESRFKTEDTVVENDEVSNDVVRVKKQMKKRKPIIRALIIIGAVAAGLVGIFGLSLLWYLIFGENNSSSGRFQASFQDTDNVKEFKHDFIRGYKTARAHIVFGENAKGEPMDIFEGNPKAPAGKVYTMITYTGNEEILKLPDGTILWMYPNSSIYFPAHFTSDTIHLKMEGKIYFETTSEKHLIISMTPPSKRTGGPSEILVDRSAATLDIRAYPTDTSFSVNLVSGEASVLIPGKRGDRPIKLLSGTQFTYSDGLPPIQEPSDTSEIFSLKNGEINLKNAGIKDIMATLTQWYGVTIEYMGQIPDKRYFLKVPLESKLSVIIEELNKQGLHITKHGKVITVVK